MRFRLIIQGILIIIIAVYSRQGLLASGSAGSSGADFLEIGIGSRALSMGEAFTAETNDINSLYYNPSGLAAMKYPVLSIVHQELIVDSRFENVTGGFPLLGGFMGISNSLFWVPTFDKIDIDGNKTGDVTFFNGCFTTGYGYDLGFMYVGGSIKYIYQKIDTLVTHSVAVDLGVLKGMYMYSPFDAPIRNFHIGFSILNVGTNANEDPLPRMIRFGLSYKLTKWYGLNIDFTENFINASDLYDFTYGFDESFRMNMGMEFTYLELLALRGGYRFNDGGTYTLGLGFNYVISDVTFLVDSSFADSGVFGPSYSFNVSFKLIPRVITVEDKRQAEGHYKSGIKYFVANDLDSSINEFRQARDYNPYHKNVDKKIKDLEEIADLMKKNEELDEELKEERKREESDTETEY
ncbi:MAG: UPF0164 family protein [bacterium]|nr:UPF0164 family protein [bacterium]